MTNETENRREAQQNCVLRNSYSAKIKGSTERMEHTEKQKGTVHEEAFERRLESLSFDERVEFFESLMPAVEKRMREEERTYDENPEIEQQYKRRYGLADFIPGFGYFNNKKRNKPLAHGSSYYFYDWANNNALSELKSGAFKLYHYGSSALIASLMIPKLYDLVNL